VIWARHVSCGRFVRFGRWCCRAFLRWPVWLGRCCRASCKVAPGKDDAAGTAESSFSIKAWAAAAAAQSRARLEHLAPDQRNFSYASLDDVVLKASPFHSWRRQDWSALRLILFGAPEPAPILAALSPPSLGCRIWR